ncbi:MAG: ankyrin repeat domain-containing protein [Acidimicrobiia bacterium]|nr:ankyrin repeat domain-containing protein [Acidimicrobiia bacterium]
MATLDAPYLFWNARAGYSLNVRRYLKRGGDPDAVDPGGYTALHIATLGGHAGVVKELLIGGADTTALDFRGQTALDIAVAQQRNDVAELLRARTPTAQAS